MADAATLSRTRGRLGLSLPLLLGLLVYGQIISHPSAVLGDPDTYWHIATGRWILAQGAVPHQDVFSFSMPGAPWDPPGWLAEIFIAWLYDHFGWAALVVVTGLCEAGALALLLRVLLRFLAPVHALIAVVLTWALALTHALARPHILTLPILVLWVAALVSARSEERAPSLWLALLITLWANLHSSYMLGLVLAALLAGEAVLLAPDWGARLRAMRGWAVFGGASAAAALITPFGIHGLIQPFELTQMSYSSAVLVEWMSPNFQRYQPARSTTDGLIVRRPFARLAAAADARPDRAAAGAHGPAARPAWRAVGFHRTALGGSGARAAARRAPRSPPSAVARPRHV